MLLGKRLETSINTAVVLNEHEVPELDDTVIADIDEFPSRTVRRKVDMDFGTGTARAGLTHLPKVVLVAELQNMGGDNVGLFLPDFKALLVVLVNGRIKPLFWEFPYFGQQFPGPADRLMLVIVAERPVAEHLEKGVVVSVAPHIFEIVVLAGGPDALLGIGRTYVLPCAFAEKHILELVHPGVGEQKRRVFGRNDRSRTDDPVFLVRKKVQKRLPYFS